MTLPEDPIWVFKPSTAAELLPHMLERFRLRYQDPLIFGSNNQPEGVIVPFEVWRTLKPSDQNEPDTAPS